ncbi:imidazoleglycerol-phosphate dehydratase [Geotoga petraea]|jgi:imidazoleglycerol-phosphate dehydratase|uniref:Imidazoleglycerol-phosphate dehydratase n=1 Tax=Geotoga petraea TaxID=28234 RepID=A0A1G6Q316_9BACT|nr:imidazoleglycerol-phosphate dehydratase [Geotoga petraea]SDC86830.1 imidazoleglycerol-phosphate dehydratase [Geotoga petraea]
MRRKTLETDIEIIENDELIIQCEDKIFSHMMKTLFYYMGLNVSFKADFDLIHHLWEDSAITTAQFLREKISDKKINRFSTKIVPMDDALILAAVDISRAYSTIELDIKEEEKGFEIGNFREFINALSSNLPATIHIKQLSGINAHHIIEGGFKSLGMALKEATGQSEKIVSTKGMI